MSTVSGALNSIATLFSYDLYRRWRPDTPDQKLVVIGRIATFVAMVIAIFWSPLVGHYQSIYQGSNTIICYLAPPITTVFIWGVFWRRASSRAALTTLVVGSFLGVAVFLLDWYKEYTHWNLQFMMAAFYLFADLLGGSGRSVADLAAPAHAPERAAGLEEPAGGLGRAPAGKAFSTTS